MNNPKLVVLKTEKNSNSNSDISDVVNGVKMSKEKKELLKKYGKLNLDNLDSEGIVKKFINDPNLRKLAAQEVNKEALKEVQIRAEWMYDAEKYKDKRSEHYTRLNFTSTGADMNKLENYWKKLLANIKSEYLVFFADESNSFPKELDPIALVNSDKTFRQSFNEYGPNEAIEKSNLKGVSNDIIPTNDKLLELLNIKNGSISDNNYGVFRIKTSGSNKNIAIIIQKIKSEYFCFKFLGLIDWDGLEKEAKEKNYNIDASELMGKYHYTRSGKNNTNKIENANDELKNIFNAFRGGNFKEKMNLENYAIGFYYRGNINKGREKNIHIPQIILKSTDDWQNVESYVAKIVDNKIVKYDLLTNISIANKDKYKFTFIVTDVYYIESGHEKKPWGIIDGGDLDKKKNKALSSIEISKIL